MGNPTFELFAVTAPGLEAVCAMELKALGMAAVRPVAGGVDFAGELRDLYRANLWLRTASRVVVRFGEFRSRDFPELYRKALRLPWGRYIQAGTRVTLRASSHRSRLQHTGRIVATVNEAMDRALGRPASPTEGPEQLVLIRFEEDRCLISVDSSGELLHRRGYREEAAHAPLRETLAAGILLLLGWNGSIPLLDPMCGSGTLPIEAALLACNRPPGQHRRFAFMHWPRYRPGLWQVLLDEAVRGERESAVPLHASDRDPQVLSAARRNASRAGLSDRIAFSCRELVQVPPLGGSGLLICNPPYGERLGGEEDLRPLFRSLGEACRRSLPGWHAAFLCPSASSLAQASRLPVRPAAALSNGGIAVTLWTTEKKISLPRLPL